MKAAKNRSHGFTIIETMIVLAIAGVFFLIVFEAVPALERSSRNNQRKQDVQTILQQVSHYELDNSGDVPDQTQLCTNLQSYAKLTYYDLSSCAMNIKMTQYGSPNESPPTLITSPDSGDVNKVDIYNYAKCSTSNLGDATGTGAGYNDIVALYAIETGSSSSDTASECQQL